MRFHKGAPDAIRDSGPSEGVEGMEDNGGSGVEEGLAKALESVAGAIGVALVDIDGGLTLGTAGGENLNLELAGAASLEIVRAKISMMQQLELDDQVEDILITLKKQYHLIHPLNGRPSLFLYMAIERGRGNLGLARHQLRMVEGELNV